MSFLIEIEILETLLCSSEKTCRYWALRCLWRTTHILDLERQLGRKQRVVNCRHGEEVLKSSRVVLIWWRYGKGSAKPRESLKQRCRCWSKWMAMWKRWQCFSMLWMRSTAKKGKQENIRLHESRADSASLGWKWNLFFEKESQRFWQTSLGIRKNVCGARILCAPKIFTKSLGKEMDDW